jgi:hypothetical protein
MLIRREEVNEIFMLGMFIFLLTSIGIKALLIKYYIFISLMMMDKNNSLIFYFIIMTEFIDYKYF